MRRNEECEVCSNNTVALVTHHIWSTSKGGPNVDWNTCRLCPNCHDSVHRGTVILEGRFESTGGNVVVYRSKGEESISGFEDPSVWLYDSYTISHKEKSLRKRLFYEY